MRVHALLPNLDIVQIDYGTEKINTTGKVVLPLPANADYEVGDTLNDLIDKSAQQLLKQYPQFKHALGALPSVDPAATFEGAEQRYQFGTINTALFANTGILITPDIAVSGDPTAIQVLWTITSAHVTEDDDEPALRYEQTEPPENLRVYISSNSGASWCEVNQSSAETFCSPVSSVRLAFVNPTSKRLYLKNYFILF